MIQRTSSLANGRHPPRMVEVGPGQFAPAPVQGELPFGVPETVFCDVVELPQGGVYKLVPRSWEQLERVTVELCARLGLGRQTRTLRRLIRGGFVDGGRVSPEVYTVNLASYFQHLKRCAEDPDYWERRDVLDQFRANY
jgi:hypothetical protein